MRAGWREAALACFATSLPLLLLLAAEGLARAAQAIRPVELLGRHLDELHVYSERYGWTPRPSFVGLWQGRRVSINARGYRGREHAVARRPGARRVVLLGDSITFGYAVADHATFAARLDARGLEALNLGVEGYGTGQQLLKLRHAGLGYRPDVVLLGVCVENDVVDNWRSAYLYDAGIRQPYFTLEPAGLVLHDEHLQLGRVARVRLFFDTHSRLLARLRGAPLALAAGAGARWRQAKADVLEQPAAPLALTFALIREVQRAAHAAGAAFGLVLHPNKRALQGRASLLPALRDAPALRDVPQLDLAAHYAARGLGPDELFVDGSGHLNEAGHREAAEALQAWLDAPAGGPR